MKPIPTALVSIENLLLISFIDAYTRWSRESSIQFDIEKHGRDVLENDLDLAESVGWFTNLYPIKLKWDAETDSDKMNLLNKVLGSVPHKGLSFSLLKYFNRDTKDGGLRSESSICFNYLGQSSNAKPRKATQCFVEDSSYLVETDPKNHPEYPLTLECQLVDEKLVWQISYADQFFTEDALVRFKYELICACLKWQGFLTTKASDAFVLNDFPLANVSSEQLRMLGEKFPTMEDCYPLAPMQSGFLFSSLYDSTSNAYFVHMLVQLDGDLDVSSLRKAWANVIEHHAVFRTAFVWEGLDEPLQCVLSSVELPWQETDWTDETSDGIDIRLEQLMREDKLTKFDLSAPPLLRVNLLLVGKNRYIMAISQHHILLDGWCLPLVMKDLFNAYESLAEGDFVSFNINRPYRDYIEWLGSTSHDEAKAYWQALMKDIDYPTRLSSNHSVKAKLATGYGTYEYNVSKDLTKKIKDASRGLGFTLNSFIQTAWGILLARFTQQQEVTFGVTVSGRSIPLKDVESMVGVFINTLPLRLSIEMDASISRVVKQVQEMMSATYQHVNLTLAEIQSYTKLSREIPLFDNIFVFENTMTSSCTDRCYAGVTVQNIPMSVQTEYPLTIAVRPSDELRFQINYRTEHFSRETISQIASNLSSILEQMSESTSQSINAIKLHKISEGEESSALASSQENTAVVAPYFIDNFIQLAENCPEVVALEIGTTQVTYSTLHGWSNLLAQKIEERALPENSLIAIALPRSAEFICAVLAILKLGHAYLPLDLHNPAARLQAILVETECPLIITGCESKENFQLVSTSILLMDRVRQPAEGVNVEVAAYRPNALAYVIYTSGSTGKSKGVMIEWASLQGYLSSALGYYPWDKGDGSLLHTSLAFDMTVTSLFLPLFTGKKITIIPEGSDTDALVKNLMQKTTEYSFVKLTPSHLKMLQEQMSPEQIAASASAIIIGGEQLYFEDVKKLLPFVSQVEIYNEYGPTEATVGCAIYKLDASLQGEVVPIGLAFEGARLFIVDPHGNQVPDGVPGELYISGNCLARGYLNNAELTTESFVNFSVNARTPARVYCTGDLVRKNHNGQLEFIRRIDRQVKIRGYRIDTIEIQNALMQHGDVKEVLVDCIADSMNEQTLVAFVLPDEFTPSEDELEHYLLKLFPQYMIPSIFVILDEFPLNTNGKVDRQLLRKNVFKNIASTVSDAKLISDEEIQLAQIWSEILQIEVQSANCDFFKMGGHSLLATRLMSRIRTTFDVKIPLYELFNHSELSAMAVLIVKYQQLDAPSNTAIEKRIYPENIPLSYAQQRLWILEKILSTPGLYNIVTAYQFDGEFSLEAFKDALNKMAMRHEVLRTTFSVFNDEPIQRIHSEPSHVLIEYEVKHNKQDEQIQAMISAEFNRELDLTSGPLFVVSILKCSEKKHVIIFNYHHVVTDGWSMSLISRDLNYYYNNYLEARTHQLEPLPIQYADFSLWQRDWMLSPELNKQLSYWKNRLHGSDFNLNLPTDHPRPRVVSYAGAFHPRWLSEALTSTVHAYCEEHGITLFMLCISVFYLLLTRISRQQDIIIGTPIANRNHPEIEDLIGFFVNTLALRFDFSADISPHAFLNAVKDLMLMDYQHQDLPFEMLIESLDATREVDKNSVFQVMFILQNAEKAELSLNGLQCKPVTGSYPFSRFDITLVAEVIDGSLKLNFNYASELFNRETIETFSQCYENILKNIIDNKTQSIAEISTLSEAGFLETIQSGRRTASFPIHSHLHRLFEDRVLLQPEKIAVCTSSGKIFSYSQLNEKANALAFAILQSGVGVNTAVGLCVPRDESILIGILGILKAGCAYVPLAPANPASRLNYIVETAEVTIVVTTTAHKNVLSEVIDVRLLYINEISVNKLNPDVELGNDSLAYIIFTSGSTGRPKGVKVNHSSVINCLYATAEEMGLSNKECMLAFASYAFDISVFDYFMPLLLGGSMIVADEIEQKSPATLVSLIEKFSVTCINATPSILELIYDGHTQLFSQSIKLISCGEPLTKHVARKLLSMAKLYNFYGPTETTIYATASEIIDPQVITIGRPLSNVSAYVVDNAMNLVPPGIPGELYLGGACVSCGYINNPALTNDAFIKNPFEVLEQKLIYKTGDLVKQLPTGELLFIGRGDSQVKIRGNRVELQEIELTIAEHPLVENAVVVLQGVGKTATLQAYLICDTELTSTDEMDVMKFLSHRLPEYMLPNKLLCIDAFPLTMSGKIDYKQLIKTTDSRVVVEYEVNSHLSVVENDFLTIWKKILQQDSIGVDDNFFESGGNSLLLIILQQHIASELNISITLLDFFQYPTIRKLIKAIDCDNSVINEKTSRRLDKRKENYKSRRKKIRSEHNEHID